MVSSESLNNGLTHNILLIEDSLTLSQLYEEYLRLPGYNVTTFDLGRDALKWLATHSPDAILLDIRLPDMDGLDILKEIKTREISSEVLIITAHGSLDMAVDAMQLGAADFLEKPFDADRLRTSLRNILQKHQLTQEISEYKKTFSTQSFEGFIGSSLAMQGVYRIIESVGPSKASVFITGESGTGKELCAEAIHQRSNRAANAFVPLNCAAIPKDLMESEIFGHVKGAFTGAYNSREGAASRAHQGTLFLDEVCEMDIDLQSKLLRFIQSGTFQKVGANKIENVDIRIVCATNRDPLAEVKRGRFREDLYYRLHVVPILLPPLRDRSEDILLLANFFLAKFSNQEQKTISGFSTEAERLLTQHRWPGNVRELQNVVQNAVVLCSDNIIGLKNLLMLHAVSDSSEAFKSTSIEPVTEATKTGAVALNKIRPLKVVEKEAIENAIEACDGNVALAASLLEVNASTLYRKLQGWKN